MQDAPNNIKQIETPCRSLTLEFHCCERLFGHGLANRSKVEQSQIGESSPIESSSHEPRFVELPSSESVGWDVPPQSATDKDMECGMRHQVLAFRRQSLGNAKWIC
jgi:hypothetical protein